MLLNWWSTNTEHEEEPHPTIAALNSAAENVVLQVRELKAALAAKQGNVAPETLLALLEAAKKEVSNVNCPFD